MSSDWFISSGHPVVSVAEAVSALLDQTVDADLWALSDDDLTDTLSRLEGLAARQAELGLRLVREAEARDLARRQGAPSTAAWLRHRLRLRPGQARMRVELANRCDPPAEEDPPGWVGNPSADQGSWSMPATAAALAEGASSIEHAAVIARTMAVLPTSLDRDQLAAAEAVLAGWAREYDPREMANLGRSLIHLLDADTLEERQQGAYDRRELHLTDMGDGSSRIRGQLDIESAAIIRAALDPLAAPAPAADGERDQRTHGQRIADALVELARRALDSGGIVPAGHAVRPHVSVLVSLDTLLAKAGESGVAPGELADGGPSSAAVVRRISCDAGDQPGDHRPGWGPARCRARTSAGHRRSVGRTGRPRRRMCVSRLHPAGQLVYRPSPHSLGRRRTHRPGQPRTALRLPPPRRSPPRLGRRAGRRPAARVRAPTVDRPRADSPA